MLFLQRLLGIVVALGLLAAALVFVSILLAIAVGAAAVVGGWLWWRTRKLRREVARTAPTVVEGEFREVPAPRLEGRSNRLEGRSNRLEGRSNDELQGRR